MATYACFQEGCGHRICLDDHVEKRLRRTGEWFVCPAGHRQHFTPGPTADQKRIAELERQAKFLDDALGNAWDRWQEKDDQARDARRAARTCPLCKTVFRTPRHLPEHLADAHGAQMAAPLEFEAVAGVRVFPGVRRGR